MSEAVRNWKIRYTKYTGIQKKAVEMVSRELSALITRDPGVYAFYTLPCEPLSSSLEGNEVIIGVYDDISLICPYIDKADIPADGYLVKVFDNPSAAGCKLMVITGHTDITVFYGAVDFLDDYLPATAIVKAGITYTDHLLYSELPDYQHASAPKIKTRSIFAWGHTINSYRDYIDHMARLKMNQIVIWNDFLPVNAEDVVSYAHEYGIELLWGYAWGWSRSCASADLEHLELLSRQIVDEYENTYSVALGDGIYFQSFTEIKNASTINGLNIAQKVTELVNMTAAELLRRYPNLKLQFGLHATSVKDDLSYIAAVDPRVEIVWEDCGAFPFNYKVCTTEEEYKETCEAMKRILSVRSGAPIGMYYKGQLTSDWEDWAGGKFVHQTGRFVLGNETDAVIARDKATVAPMWRVIQNDWLVHGQKAHDMTNRMLALVGGDVNIGMVGQFSGKIYYSFALCAQILWDCTEDFAAIENRVRRRRYVTML